MKKTIIGAAFAIAPFVAFANNTITFQGEVNAQTCAVGVNGNVNGASVLLPTAKVADLSEAGKTAGLTEFTVGLSGCTAPTADTAIDTKFVGSNSITPNGNLSNTGTAENVSLQLLDPAKEAAPFKLTAAGYNAPGLELKKDATSAEYKFGVRYFAEGVAKAGTVVGAVQYAIAYK